MVVLQCGSTIQCGSTKPLEDSSQLFNICIPKYILHIIHIYKYILHIIHIYKYIFSYIFSDFKNNIKRILKTNSTKINNNSPCKATLFCERVALKTHFLCCSKWSIFEWQFKSNNINSFNIFPPMWMVTYINTYIVWSSRGESCLVKGPLLPYDSQES